MKNYGKFVAGLVLAWFLFAVIGSARHLFQNNSDSLGVSVGIAALTPIIIFGSWFGLSKRFRQFALSLDPRILTVVQSWRIMGFVFVLLEARGLLPAVFALPAGYGDMTIGATATLVAWQLASPRHRSSFILWQVLGIADLITAVSLGTTARLIDVTGPSTALMTVLPLSLIPTLLVPLFLILHVICIAQARAWSPEGRTGQVVLGTM